MKTTHTYVLLPLSRAAYDEIAAKLRAAAYDQVFSDEGYIDLHGLAASREDQPDAASVEAAQSGEEALSKTPPGATWFMRCKDCEEMYVASQGWSMTTGKQNVYWVRPRPIRQPKKCRHDGTVQHWNGEAWVDMSALGSPTP